MAKRKPVKGASSVSPEQARRADQESTVHSSPAASGQCSSPFGASMDEKASMSPAKEAHGKVRKGDHAAGLARQVGGSCRVAAGRASAAVGGKSARKTVPAALQSPDSEHDFAELSRARPAGAKRTLMAVINETGKQGKSSNQPGALVAHDAFLLERAKFHFRYEMHLFMVHSIHARAYACENIPT